MNYDLRSLVEGLARLEAHIATAAEAVGRIRLSDGTSDLVWDMSGLARDGLSRAKFQAEEIRLRLRHLGVLPDNAPLPPEVLAALDKIKDQWAAAPKAEAERVLA